LPLQGVKIQFNLFAGRCPALIYQSLSGLFEICQRNKHIDYQLSMMIKKMCELCKIFKELCNISKSNVTYIYCAEIYPNPKKINAMSTNIIGYWNEKKEKLKQKYTIVTDEDLYFLDGKEKEMLEMLGYKLGKTKEEMVSILTEL
jgi:hypothetical protein